MSARLQLLAPSDPALIMDIPANLGYEPSEIGRLLAERAARGDTVDTNPVSNADRESIYFAVATQAHLLGIKVSQVFGSRKHSGAEGFGTTVPALLVYEHGGGRLLGVFPHQTSPGVIHTIVQFLTTAER
jgi:hypothetical protein